MLQRRRLLLGFVSSFHAGLPDGRGSGTLAAAIAVSARPLSLSFSTSCEPEEIPRCAIWVRVSVTPWGGCGHVGPTLWFIFVTMLFFLISIFLK